MRSDGSFAERTFAGLRGSEAKLALLEGGESLERRFTREVIAREIARLRMTLGFHLLGLPDHVVDQVPPMLKAWLIGWLQASIAENRAKRECWPAGAEVAALLAERLEGLRARNWF